MSSKKIVQTDSLIAKEMSEFQLIGSQKSKVYYLLKALDNKFDLQKCINIAGLRNDLTHNPGINIEQDDLEYCQKVAFWVGEKFVEIYANS